METSTNSELRQMEELLSSVPKFFVSIMTTNGDSFHGIMIKARRNPDISDRVFAHVKLMESPLGSDSVYDGDCCPNNCPTSIGAAFELARKYAADHAVLPSTLVLKVSDDTSARQLSYAQWERLEHLRRDDPLVVAAAAACTAMLPVSPMATRKPDENEKPQEVRRSIIKTRLEELLAGGKAEKAILLERPYEELKLLDLNKQNFSGLHCGHVCVSRGEMKKVDFSESIIDKLEFVMVDISGGLFRKTQAIGASMYECKAGKADFSNAMFIKSDFTNTNFSKAIFAGADLSESDFSGADVRCVDFSTCANLAGINWSGAKYDGTTIFPPGYEPKGDLVWKGTGVDPVRAARKSTALNAAASFDFSELLDHLNKDFDKARISKALSMLKKESFKLFSAFDGSSLTGVVKSQTDASLVYACHLSSTGAFSCCTQNLNACGGLRGALCKHLLVLAIGLARAGEIDCTQTARWIIASKFEKPDLNRDAMSEVFLRYMSAERGEIDWRPTETIPEDYY